VIKELQSSTHIPDRMFFKIGEVAEIVGVKAYVLRYWETEFSFLVPQKGQGDQRKYTRSEVEKNLLVKHLLYVKRFSIEGAKKYLSELRKEGRLSQEQKLKYSLDCEKVYEVKKHLHALLDLCAIEN